MGKQIFQNQGVCGQAFPLLPHHPLLQRTFALAPIYEWSGCRKALCMGMLTIQANLLTVPCTPIVFRATMVHLSVFVLFLSQLH